MKKRHNADINQTKFAGYQSNFKKLAKLLSEVNCAHDDRLRLKILEKIDAKTAVKSIKSKTCEANCSKHIFINELEKFVWILK